MEEHGQKVLLLRSAPGEPEAASALRLADCLRLQGWSVAIVLLQDAVFCAVRESRLESARALRGLLAAGASCHYLVDDLLMRGFQPSDVVACSEPIGYERLVDLLLADGASVAGAF